jgi:thiol-disulfide isomerase/thioredoxin
MEVSSQFSFALPYREFLDRYATPAHRSRWQATYDDVKLSAEQRELLARFVRRMNVLVLAGAWCGDCARQCPIFQRFAEAAPVINVRFLDRDDYPDVQQALRINGGDRVPVVVFLSEDGHEAARYGDRTLSAYRELAAQLDGAACATGIAQPGDPLLARVTQDWLNEFERVQWMLRLSPRLRQLHGD